MRNISSLFSALCLLVVSVNGRNDANGVDKWCGKAYKPGDPSSIPDGNINILPTSNTELLDLRIYPRHNIYLSNDKWAGFLVDTRISHTSGEEYCATLENAVVDVAAGVTLDFVIYRVDTGQTVVEKLQVPVNATAVQAQFKLDDFIPRDDPYEITIKSSNPSCGRTYQSNTKIFVLPPKPSGGNAVRIDYQFGGIAVNTSPATKEAEWKTLIPYAFYVDWSTFLMNSTDNLKAYAAAGYNVIHPTPGSGPVPWEDYAKFDKFLTAAEKLGLYVVYDMRWSYKNISAVKEQVERFKNRPSLLTWYTADEPDGSGDPLDATQLAYDAIKDADPYHPVSLVLNCLNYHYKEYVSGTDIVLADPYPVGINATFSMQHKTNCNQTFGDCGCDNCVGELSDVSHRFDTYARYENLLGSSQRIFWSVPQAFGGSEYWTRPPSAAEEVSMVMLAINHGAKGIVAWNYPTTPEIANVTSQLAKALSTEDVSDFILWAKIQTLGLSSLFDAVAWRVGKYVLFSIIHLGKTEYKKELKLGLGANTKAMKMIWPPNAENWFVANKAITKPGMAPLEVNVFLVETE